MGLLTWKRERDIEREWGRIKNGIKKEYINKNGKEIEVLKLYVLEH